MEPKSFARVLLYVLTVLTFCTIVCGATGQTAPPFSARTLGGETVSNRSVRGRMVLLQFWATWCPYCRRDQAAVDNVERMFASDGLMVLAVDVGESESTVRNYLKQNQRACRVALDEDKSMQASFGSHGLPGYILLDETGNIVGTQSGSGGEASLRELLSRAGLSKGSSKSRTAKQEAAPAQDRAMKVQNVQVERDGPPRPNPKTVFVLANGERLELERYTIESGALHVTVDGKSRVIPLNTLNLKATMAANRERGIELKLPANRSEVVLAF